MGEEPAVEIVGPHGLTVGPHYDVAVRIESGLQRVQVCVPVPGRLGPPGHLHDPLRMIHVILRVELDRYHLQRQPLSHLFHDVSVEVAPWTTNEEPGPDSEMQQRRQQEARIEAAGGRKNGPSRVGDVLLQYGDRERREISASFFDDRGRVRTGLGECVVVEGVIESEKIAYRCVVPIHDRSRGAPVPREVRFDSRAGSGFDTDRHVSTRESSRLAACHTGNETSDDLFGAPG